MNAMEQNQMEKSPQSDSSPVKNLTVASPGENGVSGGSPNIGGAGSETPVCRTTPGGSYSESPHSDHTREGTPIHRNPSPPPELLDQSKEFFHGDEIGDTAFSKHWLFTTLLKLIREVDHHDEDKDEKAHSDFGVNVDEDLQNELCKLWDMSMNPEVAMFLQEFKCIDILSSVIGKSKAPRVNEICVGILGNMACNADICKDMSNRIHFKELMLSLLDNSDPPTLIETTRFLRASLSATQPGRDEWVEAVNQSETVFSNVLFILQSSTNADLLKNTGSLIDTLLDASDDVCQTWSNPDLVTSLQEAIKQIGHQPSETLEVYFHIFHQLSTTDSGIEAIVSQCNNLIVPFITFLRHICDDEVISIVGHERSLAAVVPVLTAIFLSQDGSPVLSEDRNLMRCLLKVLEAVRHKTTESRDEPPADGLEPTPKSKLVQSHKDGNTHTPEQHTSSNNTANEGSRDQTTALDRIINALYKDIVEFLEYIIGYYETLDCEEPPIGLAYLDDACSRERITCMLASLSTVAEGKQSAVDQLRMLAGKYKLDRLTRIIHDTNVDHDKPASYTCT